MTVIEQLRKEINELRERIAVLERRSAPLTQPPPNWTPTVRTKDPLVPPFTITCESNADYMDRTNPYRPPQPQGYPKV